MNRWLATVGVTLASAVANAHHGPDTVVAKLDEQIRQRGADAHLLTRRADELRVLGEDRRAAADYRAALRVAPGYGPAVVGLAKSLLARGDFTAAAEFVDDALRDSAAAEPFTAELHALAARAAEGLGDDEAALGAWTAAVERSATEVDWLLGHAAALRRLGRREDCRDALHAATRRNPSVVLRRAWIASLIECGDLDEARGRIQAGVERSRFRSSWLLLRARLRRAEGDAPGALLDARSAGEELSERLEATGSNPLLEEQLREATALSAALMDDSAG